jgi:concentrative nucleoside transporter, CNT family
MEPKPAANPAPTLARMPVSWRVLILSAIVFLASATFLLSKQGVIGPRIQSAIGVICFLGLACAFSANLRMVSRHTVIWGFCLQLLIALFILKLRFTVDGQEYRPGFALFSAIGSVVRKFLEFSNDGARFVFGNLANREAMDKVFGPGQGFVFAFTALSTVIFISAFFTVLYYLGILQWIVRGMARGMMYVMRTSGAETLSVAANVFMGQTEAPLIVRPYVPKMTQSELLALMVGGMAHISGGVMAVYIGMGADAVAILATSVMAAPASLYLAKIILPETEEPLTRGIIKTDIDHGHRNIIDAASAGASEGMKLAINIAAMLIAFLAFIAMINYGLSWLDKGFAHVGSYFGIHWMSEPLSLEWVFGKIFSPAAFLMGVEPNDVPKVGELLGKKLVVNEFVAYVDLTTKYTSGSEHEVVNMSRRSFRLSTYALTGFANFASIGIQIGGIGAMAPERRKDLARLGWRALFTGFLATLLNASLAGTLGSLDD